ncbi:uncharacterized protein [Malus domestica]|uniref:uncharacterized protein n=1 Tax=Malus domestica TaxID=3750 RepID=UPI0039764589
MSPYQVVYGIKPLTIHMYMPCSTVVQSVDVAFQDKDKLICLLRTNLQLAQNRMRQVCDNKRTEREFNIGDWVYLKLHPYRQHSVAARTKINLASKFYGSFQVTQCIGFVTYRLLWPTDSKIHQVFHVSLLKRKLGNASPPLSVLPSINSTGVLQW